MDLSQRPELRPLSKLVQAIQEAAPGEEWLLVGATARDLLLHYAHGIHAGRATMDVDFGIAVRDWDHFFAIREMLQDSGRLERITRAEHKFRFNGGIEVDLVPFGGIERVDGTIAWPPDGDPLMTVIGFTEAMRTAIRARLPDAQEIPVVCLPLLVLLKFVAWGDNQRRRRGVDARDILTIISNYVDCGNRECLFDRHADLLDRPDFDYELAGSMMAGRDLKFLLEEHSPDPQTALGLLREIVHLQLESDQPGRLIRDVPARDIERFRDLLTAFHEGIS